MLQCVYDALARTVEERKATPPKSNEENDGDNKFATSEPLPCRRQRHHAFHEAAAVLNLHAQIVAMQNIRSLVPT